MKELRIAIVGYGVAGISAAIMLRRLGHRILHFERATVPGVGGAGLLLNNRSLDVLGHLGLRNAALARGAMISGIYGTTLRGSKIMDLRYGEYSPGNFGLGIQRKALHELLRAADEQAAQVRLAHISSADAERGYLFDEQRRPIGPFDLIVAADGAGSHVRTGVRSLIRRDRNYRSSAIVCLIDDPNRVFGCRVSQYYSGGHHIAIWPVGSGAPGGPHRINVSLNVSNARAEHFRATEVWRRHAADLCPALVPLLEQLDAKGELLLFTYRDVALRRYYTGRVALIGDAAHSMSPQLGQGVTMALLDSQALAQALDTNCEIATALADFDRTRRIATSRYQRVSRWVTPIFQSENRAIAMFRDWAFYRASRLPYVRRSMLKMLSGA
jgi:2-polyprenyl-6-methoxyphenol hydroxylase-like FAD-dependent oxidoreductase